MISRRNIRVKVMQALYAVESQEETVMYGKYSGTEIQIEGDDLLIMRESDILAIV